MWRKIQKNENDADYTYFCKCGKEMDDELEYNPESRTYICLNCGSESPDLYNITEQAIKMPETKRGDKLHCLRCGGDWYQAGENPPKTCRYCNSPDWNKPRIKAATVQAIPKTIEKSNPEDYYLGVRVLHKNGRYGTVLSPKIGLVSTTLITLIVDHQGINTKVPIEKLKIVQAVD